METNPKCPECNYSPLQHAICTKRNPIFQCYYAIKEIMHSHHFCGICGCKWIGF